MGTMRVRVGERDVGRSHNDASRNRKWSGRKNLMGSDEREAVQSASEDGAGRMIK